MSPAPWPYELLIVARLAAAVLLAALVVVVSVRMERRFEAAVLRALDECKAIDKKWQDEIDDANDLVMIFDAHGRVCSLSSKGARLLGYARNDAERLQLGDLFDARFVPLLQFRAEDVDARDPGLKSYDVLAYTRNRQEVWLDLRATFIRGEDGSVVCRAAARDVTSYRQAADKGATRSALVGGLADATSRDASVPEVLEILCREIGADYAELWRADEQFSVLRSGPRWHDDINHLRRFAAATTSRTFPKGTGLPGRAWALEGPMYVADLRTQADADYRELATECGFSSALAFPIRLGGRVNGAAVLLALENGRLKPPSAATLEMMGNQIGLFAERKRSESALRVSEARKQAILECALDCVITLDHEGRILEFNPAAEKTFGYRRADVLGRNLAGVLIPPEQREAFASGLERYLVKRESPLIGTRAELEALRADGTRVPVEVAVAAIHVGDSPVFTGYLRDISQQKEVAKLKDELVSTVSHELRTPLATIKGFVELLIVRENPVEEQHEYLEIVHDEIERLTRLINDFLDLQRIESGRQEYRFESADLALLVSASVSITRKQEKEHEVALDLRRPQILAQMDSDRVQQVLTNLISNALKFSPDGGTVTVEADVREGKAFVAVRDEGIGMSEETLDKLFTRFFRADNSATSSIAGTGLGLALCQEIVSHHGGIIWAESVLGRGSRFCFTLPLADGDNALAPVRASAPA